MAKVVWTVYKTVHIESGKFYIGVHKTRNPDDRYLGSGKLIGRALKAHGRKAFKKEILHVFDNPDDAYQKEAERVHDAFVARADTYNLTTGGRGQKWGRFGEENSQAGTVWVHRNGTEKKLSGASLQEAEKQGWTRGRSSKAMERAKKNLALGGTQGLVAISDADGRVRFVPPEEKADWIRHGWVEGYDHQQTLTPEGREALRRATSRQRRGQPSPTKGRVRVYRADEKPLYIPRSSLQDYLARGYQRGMRPEERARISATKTSGT